MGWDLIIMSVMHEHHIVVKTHGAVPVVFVKAIDSAAFITFVAVY